MNKNNWKDEILDFYQKIGFTQISNIFLINIGKLGITGNEYLIISVIKMFAFQKDEAFPSLAKLINITSLSKHTIIDTLKSLEKKGFLKIIKNLNSNNLYKSNTYSLRPLLEIIEKITINSINKEDTGVVQNLHYGSAEIAPGVVQNLHPNKKNNNKNKIITYTQDASTKPALKNVCEENNKSNSHTPSLKVLELFKNEDENVLFKIGKQHKDAAIAGKYLDYQVKKGKIVVKNPCGLLIKTLKDGLYSDVDEIILEEKQKIANENQKIIAEIKKREKEEEAEKLVNEYIAKMPEDEKNNRIKKIIIENNYKDDDLGNIFVMLKLKAEVSNMLENGDSKDP
jgi:hypothetical protein